LADAARHAHRNADGTDIRHVARALEEFGSLARWAVPVHGVFVPNNDDVVRTIDVVAKRHLALGRARQEFRAALSAVEPFGQRDAVESAQNRVQTASDEAYFYAGVAFGVVLVNCR
jgi:hypothetical protein